MNETNETRVVSPQAVRVDSLRVDPLVDHVTDVSHEHVEGPKPIGTLVVIAILLLVTIAFWMMVLGIQQGRA